MYRTLCGACLRHWVSTCLPASGSELNLAVEAAKEIEGMGKTARVVSMVCWELFEDQDDAYKQSILPPDVTARVRSCLPFKSSAAPLPSAALMRKGFSVKKVDSGCTGLYLLS